MASPLTVAEIERLTQQMRAADWRSHRDDSFNYAMSRAAGSPMFDPGHGHGHAPIAQAAMPGKFSEQNMVAQVAMRMGWNLDPGHKPFSKISAHKLNDEQAAVFIIVDGKALIIHDDLNLFPSDALVTQIRLLETK